MKNILHNQLICINQTDGITKQSAFDIRFSVSKTRERAVYIACDKVQLPYALFLANRIVSTADLIDFDVVLCSTVEETSIDTNLLNGIRYGQIIDNFAGLFHVNGRIPVASYYKLFIPYEISEYSKAVYIDTDTYTTGSSLSKFLDVDLEGATLGAILDGNIWGLTPDTRHQRKYRKKIRNDPSNYFNGGVLLIDIEKYICRCSLDNLLARMERVKKLLRFHDQSFLNHEFQNETKLISPRWNFPMIDALLEIKHHANPNLLHYVGPRKAWCANNNGYLSPVTQEYIEFLSENGFSYELKVATDINIHANKPKYKSKIRNWLSNFRKRRKLKLAKSRAKIVWKNLTELYPD